MRDIVLRLRVRSVGMQGISTRLRVVRVVTAKSS
jgi:hypothetical protein